MKYGVNSLDEFSLLTFSSAPAPGGGGVCAYVSALGVALSGMVSNLTVGKKKYEIYEKDLKEILEESEALRKRFLQLIDEDEEAFLPLAKAYSLPKEERAEVMEEALKVALSPPYEMMKLIVKAISLHKELLTKGSKMVLSDVGVGVALLESALKGAYLNVEINLKDIKDEEYFNKVNLEVNSLLEIGEKEAKEIFIKVKEEIEG